MCFMYGSFRLVRVATATAVIVVCCCSGAVAAVNDLERPVFENQSVCMHSRERGTAAVLLAG